MIGKINANEHTVTVFWWLSYYMAKWKAGSCNRLVLLFAKTQHITLSIFHKCGGRSPDGKAGETFLPTNPNLSGSVKAHGVWHIPDAYWLSYLNWISTNKWKHNNQYPVTEVVHPGDLMYCYFLHKDKDFSFLLNDSIRRGRQRIECSDFQEGH